MLEFSHYTQIVVLLLFIFLFFNLRHQTKSMCIIERCLINCCSSTWHAASTSMDVSLYYKGKVISNNSLIPLESLKEGEPLYCVTPLSSCCANTPTGNWYAPTSTSTSPSPVNSIGETQTLLYQNRSDDGSVRLHAKNDSSSFTSGLHRCLIPDGERSSQELFIGIYSSDGGTKTHCLFKIVFQNKKFNPL